MHRSQAAVYTPQPHHHPSHDLHLWRGSKCHQKGTLGTHRGVLRSWEVSPELGGGPGDEHGPIGENWGHDGVEMGLRGREWEGGEWK